MNFNGFCHDLGIVNKKFDWLVISSLNSYWFIVGGKGRTISCSTSFSFQQVVHACWNNVKQLVDSTRLLRLDAIGTIANSTVGSTLLFTHDSRHVTSTVEPTVLQQVVLYLAV